MDRQKILKLTDFEQFSPYFEKKKVPAKIMLLREGQVSKTMFFIEKGCLRTWIKSVFKTMGYKNLDWISFTSVKRVSQEKRVRWLSNLEGRFSKFS